MHPCLRVDEIIRLVACELVELEANGTVAALACCCKSFEEPVLDVLWETQVELTLLWSVCRKTPGRTPGRSRESL